MWLYSTGSIFVIQLSDKQLVLAVSVETKGEQCQWKAVATTSLSSGASNFSYQLYIPNSCSDLDHSPTRYIFVLCIFVTFTKRQTEERLVHTFSTRSRSFGVHA
ncbi:hypothetical protein L1887_38017 [Cichorium endivia]|nr:hypothetical protein L1887_38017 [Cichorium endivia]